MHFGHEVEVIEEVEDIFVGLVVMEAGLCFGVGVGNFFRVDGTLGFLPDSVEEELLVRIHQQLQLKRFTFQIIYTKLNQISYIHFKYLLPSYNPFIPLSILILSFSIFFHPLHLNNHFTSVYNA